MHLANMRGQVLQGRQWLLTGVDHVAEVEQGMQARMVETLKLLRNLMALEFFMLLEVKEQVVQVGLPGHIAKVMFNLRQHP